MIIKRHNKYIVRQLEVQPVNSHPGTQGADINVQGDGFKSDNQLYDKCYLSVSS